MLFALFFLAQASTDPISGGAGWVGAGLLGLVLGWLLLIHLPAKDKFLKEFLEAKDKQLTEVMVAKWQMLERMSADYRADLKEISEHCERELSAVSSRFSQDLVVFRELAMAIQEWMDEQRGKH